MARGDPFGKRHVSVYEAICFFEVIFGNGPICLIQEATFNRFYLTESQRRHHFSRSRKSAAP
jgi:hypothetical protein